MSIYQPISGYCKDITARFNEFMENKLLVIDESDDHGKPQYTMLKKLSGQSMITIEKKFKGLYDIKNNLNLIIIANGKLPIHVDSYEKPENENQNQFFVYEMPKSHTQVQQGFVSELSRRFGYYMRTELKPIFDSLNINGNRYSFPVPITDEEKNLFNISKTDNESKAENVMLKLLDKTDDPLFEYREFVKDGFIPSEWLNDRSCNRDETIIKELQKRDYLAPDPTTRKKYGNVRKRCYKLGKRWFVLLAKEGIVSSEEPTETPELTETPDLFVASN
jgi:hypothetical protein